MGYDGQYKNTRYDRHIGVWSEEFQERLQKSTVGVAGLGAQAYIADILARNGVGTLKIADPDNFDVTNVQRQGGALESTIGKNKTTVTAARIRDINPAIGLVTYEEGITFENIDRFIDGCTFVHDGMDYFVPELKIALHRKARERGIVTTASFLVGMGASAFVFDPRGMTFEEYFEYPGPGQPWKIPHDKITGRRDPDYINRDFFLSRVGQGQVPTSSDAAYFSSVLITAALKRLLLGKEVPFVPRILRIDPVDDDLLESLVIDMARGGTDGASR